MGRGRRGLRHLDGTFPRLPGRPLALRRCGRGPARHILRVNLRELTCCSDAGMSGRTLPGATRTWASVLALLRGGGPTVTSTGTGLAQNEANTTPDSELTIAIDPRTAASGPVAKHTWHLVPSSRYRHPGDVIRLVASGLVLIVVLAAVAAAPGQLVRSGAPTVTWLGSRLSREAADRPGASGVRHRRRRRRRRVSRYRRFRLLAQVLAGALIAGAALSAIFYLAADKHPHTMASTTGQGSWLTGARFPSPALFATAAAIASR